VPTRPVTWDLDIPPASPLESVKKTPPAREVPSIAKLRISLTGTRFELLKISTFAAFLLAFVGVAIHGSHLANPDNQFAANSAAAIKALAGSVSNQSTSLFGETEALALGATQKAWGFVDYDAETLGTAPASSRQTTAAADAAATRVARVHHKAMKPVEFETASLRLHPGLGGRHRHSPVAVTGVKMHVVAGDRQRSGNPLEVLEFVAAEGWNAGYRFLNLMQSGIGLSGLSHLPSKGKGAMNSLRNRFDVTNPDSAALLNPSSMFESLVSADNLAAGIAALLFYMIFVVVLVRAKGGLRAFAMSHAV